MRAQLTPDRLLLLRHCWRCQDLGPYSADRRGSSEADPLQWKKYLTTLQITQFIIDLFVVFFASKSTAIDPHVPALLKICSLQPLLAQAPTPGSGRLRRL